MHHSLPTLATHLPAVAWGGSPIDSGIHALLGSAPSATVDTSRILAASACDGADHWQRFASELTAVEGTASLDIGKLFTELVLLARGIGASNQESAAQEILSLAPATSGDLSALPSHAELSAFAISQGGVLLVRDPSSGMTAGVGILPAHGALTWRVSTFRDVPMAPQAPSISRAAAELTDAVHGAAELIAESSGAYTAGSAGAPAIPETVSVDFPTALGGRASQLFERADTIEKIRLMANNAESLRGAPAEQQPALWKLQSGVNLARRAAVSQFAAAQLALRRAHSPAAQGGAQGPGDKRNADARTRSN